LFEENILGTKTLSTIAAAVAASFLFSGFANAGSLGLKMADKMANACLAMAAEKGWRMNVAVMDSGADLVVFKRMDGAFLGSVEVAMGKARTSANFPFSTKFVAELAHGKDGAPGPVPGIANFPGIVTFAGGLPVMNAAGEQLGSIGVSGASSGDDELCAQAGIDAVADMLK
jgi:glc operon protein GlcG